MSDAKFTPGPWSDESRSGCLKVVFVGKPRDGFDRNAVCLIADGTSDERAANARLIAAAPELYGALNAMLKIFAKPHNETLHEVISARVAIAKATA